MALLGTYSFSHKAPELVSSESSSGRRDVLRIIYIAIASFLLTFGMTTPVSDLLLVKDLSYNMGLSRGQLSAW